MTDSPLLNLARVIDCTRAEGPGLRFCVWTQGCLQKCPGCCNSAMQPLEAREMVSPSFLGERLAHAQSAFGVEGVTFLGGEPILQAHGLAEVARFAQSRGLSVIVFTGYTIAECASFPYSADLLAATDVVVDGPFIAEMPERFRNWVGSANQRFHYLTSRYNSSIETAEEFRNVVELRENGGRWFLNGCPSVISRCTVALPHA